MPRVAKIHPRRVVFHLRKLSPWANMWRTMNDTMRYVHKYIDDSKRSDGKPRETWEFEQAVLLPIEFLLLVAAAVPVVTGWRSGLANAIILALRMTEAYWRREEGSVYGRHKEDGGIAALPERKLARAKVREKILTTITWIWPGLSTMVQAAEAQTVTWAVGIGIVVTMVRLLIGSVAMPAWRKSRLEWKAIRAELAT